MKYPKTKKKVTSVKSAAVILERKMVFGSAILASTMLLLVEDANYVGVDIVSTIKIFLKCVQASN